MKTIRWNSMLLLCTRITMLVSLIFSQFGAALQPVRAEGSSTSVGPAATYGTANVRDLSGEASKSVHYASEMDNIDVGIVLPSSDEPRWLQDEAHFRDALQSAGFTSEIVFSQNDSNVEKAKVESLLSKNIKVLIICPVDSSAATTAVEEARAANVKVISYDRLVRDTNAVDYYVTFDSFSVGQQMGQYLVDHVTGTGNPLYLYAGATSDNNSFLFFQGSWSVLQPKIADGTFVIANSSQAVAQKNQATLTREQQEEILAQITTDWMYDTAKNLAQANLSAVGSEGKGDVFILAPNDGTARAIADTFAADTDVTSYIITGQDAERDSIRYILDGKQTMTILKDVRTLVSDAVAAAQTYLEAETPVSTATYNNGVIDVPADPTSTVVVDQSNLQSAIFDSGYYNANDFAPYFSVRANDDQIEAWDWPLGSHLTVNIYADGLDTHPADYTTDGTVTGPADWDPRNYLAFHLNGDFDIQAGNLVMVSNGSTIKRHIVTNL